MILSFALPLSGDAECDESVVGPRAVAGTLVAFGVLEFVGEANFDFGGGVTNGIGDGSNVGVSNNVGSGVEVTRRVGVAIGVSSVAVGVKSTGVDVNFGVGVDSSVFVDGKAEGVTVAVRVAVAVLVTRGVDVGVNDAIGGSVGAIATPVDDTSMGRVDAVAVGSGLPAKASAL